MNRGDDDVPISVDEHDIDEEGGFHLPLHELSTAMPLASTIFHGNTGHFGEASLNAPKKHSTLRDRQRQLFLAVKGVHYIEFAVGRPLQKLKLAVSINSPYVIFPCSQSDCKKNDCGYGVPFNRFKSNTFQEVGCGDCSGNGVCEDNRCIEKSNDWEIYKARDYFLSDKGSFDVTFACQTSTGGFHEVIEQTANGVLGLATASTSYINQMNRAGIIQSSIFAMCFRRYPHNVPNHSTVYESAGTLDLGGYDSTYLSSPVVYLKNSNIDGKYTAEITNVYLREGGGLSVIPDKVNARTVKLDFAKFKANKGPGSVIDTTSPVTLLNAAMEDSFKLEFFRMTGKAFSYESMALSDTEVLQLPTILIQMKTSFGENQFPDPNKIIGLVGTVLDPDSPTDVLLAIPATNYMHKRKDGRYQTLLSVNHAEGSILGSNAFQGRLVVFTTGYSTEFSAIGIAEADKCTADDPDFDTVGLNSDNDDDDDDNVGITDLPSPNPTPNEINIITTSPTISPRFYSPNYPIVNYKDTFEFWPIIVAGALFVAAVAILLLSLALRKTQSEKKPEEDETGDSEGSNNDAGSFISYGLRSHLFSVASSKPANSVMNNQRTRRTENVALTNARMMDEEANFSAIGNESSIAPRQPDINSSAPHGRGNSSSREREPLVAEALPIQQAQVVHALPVFADNPESGNARRRKSSSSDRDGGNKSGRSNRSNRSRGSARSLNKRSNSGLGKESEQKEKKFLVEKGIGIYDSSDEEDQQGTIYSREMSRRQLQMVSGGRGRDGQSQASNQTRSHSKNAHEGKLPPKRRRDGNVESSAGDFGEVAAKGRGGRNRSDGSFKNENEREIQGERLTSSRHQRQTMDMGYSGDRRRTSREKRSTTDARYNGDATGTGSVNKAPHRRGTIDNSHRNGNERGRSPKESRPSMGFDNERRKPTATRRRATMNTSSHGQRRRPTMDNSGKTKSGGSFKSLDRSKINLSGKARNTRDSKPDRPSKAFDHSPPTNTIDNSSHMIRRVSAEPLSQPFAHPVVSKGTVINVRDDASIVSGLSFAIPGMSGRRESISSSKHSYGGRRGESIGGGSRRRESIGGGSRRRESIGGGSRRSSTSRRRDSIGASSRRSSSSNRKDSSVVSRNRSISSSRHKRGSESSDTSRHSVRTGRGSKVGSRESSNSYGQPGMGGLPNQAFGTSDEDSSASGTQRKSLDLSRRMRPPNALMRTIKEDPSKRSIISKRSVDDPSRKNVARDSPSRANQMKPSARNRNAMEENQRHQVDMEIESRGLPAAPSYRIMPRGNNSMW